MTDPLTAEIAKRIAKGYARLSIVENPDGLLLRPEVRSLLAAEQGLQVVSGSNIALRLHYELHYKTDATPRRYIYVTEEPENILPDMAEEAYCCRFAASDLFPLLADRSLVNRQTPEVLRRLLKRKGIRRIGMAECEWMIDAIKQEIEAEKRCSAQHFATLLSDLEIDRDRPAETIHAVSTILAEAIKAGVSDDLNAEIADINNKFQQWVDAHYFATLHSSPLFSPKSVNGILPYIESNHDRDDKVALVVIDGFSYWQYAVLRRFMVGQGLRPTDGSTLAWLPTITMLSRQAIFRGAPPLQDYKQAPDSERKLWTDYWTSHGFGSYEVQYVCDSDEFAINEGVKRLAVVTVEMDEKMHSSTDYRDLLSLTENWSPRIVEKLKALTRSGYVVYLTSDHGSVQAHGRRKLTRVEKVFLYKDGSRGARHLIYNDSNEQRHFAQCWDGDTPLLSRDNWLCMRTDECFDREGTTKITHGGSHFMEVVVPFVKIDATDVWKDRMKVP